MGVGIRGILITSGMTLALVAATRGADPEGEPAPALIVVKGAEKVAVHSLPADPDRTSVSYEVRAAYPAREVIDEIRTRLEKLGWKGMPREAMNATNPSALRVGWRNHVNKSYGNRPSTQSFVWDAQWSGADGDVVSFTLMYLSKTVSPEGQAPKPDTDALRVTGILKKKYLLPLDGLPPSLIVLDGAMDVSAWRLLGDQRLGYDLTAPRPPSEAMATLAERLRQQGWKTEAEPAPPLFPADKWAETHKPGWNFGTSGGYGGHLEWRATWRNASGSTVRYILTYAGALPAGVKEDPERGVTTYYVQAELNPSGRGRVGVFPPSGTPSVRSVAPPSEHP